MATTRALIVAATCAAVLGLAGCAGSASWPMGPDPAASGTPTAASDLGRLSHQQLLGTSPFAEGPVDLGEFASRYRAAMLSVTSMTVRTTTASGEGDSVSRLDMSDAASPRSYSQTQTGGQVLEVVVEGATTWMRTDGADWVAQGIDNAGEDAWDDPAEAFQSVELVNATEGKFAVELKLSPSSTETIPATLYVDDQFRAKKLELDANGVRSTTEYLDYNEPVEIPEVG